MQTRTNTIEGLRFTN